jgi:5-methylcytosine-specific restriction endonuclease McrA
MGMTCRYCPRCETDTERYKSGDCRACAAIYRERAKERKSAVDKAYRENNRAVVLAKKAEYRNSRKAEVLEKAAAYREANGDAIRRYREDNREFCLESTRKWRATVKGKAVCKVIYAKRRLMERSADGTFTSDDVVGMLFSQEAKCVYCKACLLDAYHVDHILPLKLGGSNSPENLQLLCPSCNLRKSARHPDIFEREIGYVRTR